MTPLRIRKRGSSTVPFGWDIHPDNSSLLIENSLESEVISYIKNRRENISLRTMSAVVQARTGRKLTPRGVQKILDRKY